MGQGWVKNSWFQKRLRGCLSSSKLLISLFLGGLIFSLTSCSSALAAERQNNSRVEQHRIHGAQILPPAWTATPFHLPPTPRKISTPFPYAPPTQHIQSPLFSFQETRIIGYSVEGRPLEVIQFGSGPKDLMIVAGIHGGYEWNTIALADELIEFLDQRPEIIPVLVSLHFLRSLNPDGAMLKNNPWGRGNAHHVDLNRNWDSDWSIDVPKPYCWDITPLTAGPHPGSEPETQALMQYILEHDIEALISYHSAGLGIFPGGKPPTEKSLSLAEAIAEVSNYPYPPIDIGCEYTGTMTDWAADHGIAAIDIELSTHWNTDFEQNLLILQTFLNWQP
jgi:protein MpaA